MNTLTTEFEAARKSLGDDQVRMRRRADLEKKLSAAKQLEEQTKKRVAHTEAPRAGSETGRQSDSMRTRRSRLR